MRFESRRCAFNPRLTIGSVVAALIAVLFVPVSLHSESAEPSEVVSQFLESTGAPLESYRAVRHLHASARGGRMTASMTVLTTLDPQKGFEYAVLDQAGSGLIRRKVFLAALDAERDAKQPAKAARGALTVTNYEFVPNGPTEDGLLQIDIRPRRSDTLLVQGHIIVTTDTADLVRVEGRLMKRPSFWTRRVEVLRQYMRLAGVRVPVTMESVADVLLAGRSTFSMTYEYESVNGHPVAAIASLGAAR